MTRRKPFRKSFNDTTAQSDRESLVERAYEKIRHRILENEYPPAQQILERTLAVDLGMSRTPVREALVRLQNEGLIQLIPRHGMRVIPLSTDDLRDVYEVLTALELTAIERVIRNGINKRTLENLDTALHEMDAALKRGDHLGWAKADERFHRALLDLSGNPRLAAIANSMWDQGHRARVTTVRLRPSLQSSNRDHRALADAVRRGDLRRAKSIHLKHRIKTSEEIISLLRKCSL